MCRRGDIASFHGFGEHRDGNGDIMCGVSNIGRIKLGIVEPALIHFEMFSYFFGSLSLNLDSVFYCWCKLTLHFTFKLGSLFSVKLIFSTAIIVGTKYLFFNLLYLLLAFDFRITSHHLLLFRPSSLLLGKGILQNSLHLLLCWCSLSLLFGGSGLLCHIV